jgi:hypothetical protein
VGVGSLGFLGTDPEGRLNMLENRDKETPRCVGSDLGSEVTRLNDLQGLLGIDSSHAHDRSRNANERMVSRG